MRETVSDSLFGAVSEVDSGMAPGEGALAQLSTDAGRDRIEVQIRLDVVVLVVQSDRGQRSQAELTPADARALGEALARAAEAAEQTPRS